MLPFWVCQGLVQCLCLHRPVPLPWVFWDIWKSTKHFCETHWVIACIAFKIFVCSWQICRAAGNPCLPGTAAGASAGHAEHLQRHSLHRLPLATHTSSPRQRKPDTFWACLSLSSEKPLIFKMIPWRNCLGRVGNCTPFFGVDCCVPHPRPKHWVFKEEKILYSVQPLKKAEEWFPTSNNFVVFFTLFTEDKLCCASFLAR